MIAYPEIDPILFEIGPLAVRWYSLAYVAGIVLGCIYADYLNKKPPIQKGLKVFDDFMVWIIIGIIAGGRMGYVLFYNFDYYSSNIADAFKLWHGGMSFHGGFIGVAVATIIYCRKKNLKLWPLFDLAACSAPIGLFFGRVANFINGELYGRTTDVSWGMVFPNGGDLPRHPSQLYEAFLEGLVIFTLLFILAKFTRLREKAGVMTGIFLTLYGASRIIVENFREPDEQIGFLIGHLTTGQMLSLPMVIAGIAITIWAARKPYES